MINYKHFREVKSTVGYRKNASWQSAKEKLFSTPQFTLLESFPFSSFNDDDDVLFPTTDTDTPKTSVVESVPHSPNRSTDKQRLNTDNNSKKVKRERGRK